MSAPVSYSDRHCRHPRHRRHCHPRVADERRARVTSAQCTMYNLPTAQTHAESDAALPLPPAMLAPAAHHRHAAKPLSPPVQGIDP